MRTKKEFNAYLHKLQNGDRQAIIFFYNSYYHKMITIGRKFVSEMIAEDIASDILLKLLEHPQNYKDVGEPIKWIYTSVKNAALNYLKRDKKTDEKYKMHFEASDELCATVDEQVSAKIELERFFNSLDDTDHEIAVYHFASGYKHKEISKMLHMPVGTIKRRIHNMRKKLKNIEF